MDVTDTDLDCIRRAKQGEAAAFDEIIRRYSRRVYQVVYGLVRNSADAEDLVQDAFIRAYENIRSFDERYRFYTWMYRITVNLCFTFLKRRKRAPASMSDCAAPDEPEMEVPDERSGRTPGELDRRRSIEKALRCLPEEQRAVLMLRTYDELSYAEIAEVMNTSIGTVMSRLSRARDKMRELLRGYVEGRA